MVVFILFGTGLILMVVNYLYLRFKKWTPEIESILERNGFNIIDERPTNFEEAILYGMPIKSLGKFYFSTRILTVRDSDIIRKFCVHITKSPWGKIKLKVIKEFESES